MNEVQPHSFCDLIFAGDFDQKLSVYYCGRGIKKIAWRDHYGEMYGEMLWTDTCY